VYVAAAGAWARSADMAAGLSAATAAFFVAEGAAYANKSFGLTPRPTWSVYKRSTASRRCSL
jgi:hypothetical protein